MQQREMVIDIQPWIAWVWFGTLPDKWRYEPAQVKEVALDGFVFHPEEQRSVCLRLARLRDPGHSGLLGVQFLPQQTEKLYIRAKISERADENHMVNAGLPTEFAQTVLDEAIAAVRQSPHLGTGVLDFSYAAWHRIDSNQFIFRLLTRCLIRLLDPHFEAASENDLRNVMINELRT